MATELEVSVEKHEKTVLVHLNERARPVKFSGGVTQLTASIKRSFEDVLVRGDEQLILQIKQVEHRSQIRVIVAPGPVTMTRKLNTIDEPQKSHADIVHGESSGPSNMQLCLAPSSSGRVTLQMAPKKNLDVVTLEEHKYLGSEEIKAMSTIFKKETKRPLTNYQKRINEAAQELCLANPGLLQKRKLLLDEARAKIIQQGFQFVKGKSRSKQDRNDSQPTQTRRKYSQSMRDQRMRDIEEDSQDLADRIAFKEKRISSCENMRDYQKV